MNRKWLSFFITKYINVNTVLFFNFVYLFDCHREYDSFVIKILKKCFIRFFYSLWIFVLKIKMPNMTPSEAFIIIFFSCLSILLNCVEVFAVVEYMMILS